MASHSISILLLLAILASIADATIFSFYGTVYCHQNSMAGVVVDLKEHDRIPGDRDDFLGSSTTNDKGEFKVSGEESEIWNEEPYLWIIHKCTNDPLPEGCQYISRLDVKEDFHQKKMWNMKVAVNLIDDKADVDGKAYTLTKEKDGIGC